VIKIPQFEVGGEYKDDNGNEYKVLSIQGDLMEAKFNFVKKKFRIIRYGSTMAAVNSGRVWFRSAKPDPTLLEKDYTCDIVPRGKYNKLTDMTPEQRKAYRRERARARRKARREGKTDINKTEVTTGA
jgi:hypothetical protein